MSQAPAKELIAEGTKIGHYRIISPLGAGGMGAVYKAHDEKLDRIVAVKVIQPDMVAHEDRRRRFLQEARAASALNHPHILTVYEIGDADGRPFIVMEFIEGETLRQKIAARSIAVGDALDIAIQIAQGLSKAHDHGIVHRDLKPENLMISRDGYAKILDFGLAKLIERKRAARADSAERTKIQVITRSGVILGTVKYMSPEQLLGRRIDLRSDIFSFGVVLYEMLTHLCPFANENDIDTMHSILHDEPTPPHAIRPDLPRAVHGLLAKALAKEPKQRYQTIKEFTASIRTLKRDLEMGKSSIPVKTRLVLKPVSAAARRAPKIDYERELNEAQYEAVTTVDGPILIVAGAGTGKTRTLVYRVARLIETGARPESVLLLTFTRRAAQSMLARAASLADERCQRVSGGTFHSIAHSTLRRYSELAGVHRMFTVFDQSDTEDLIDLVRRQAGFTTRDRRFPRKHTIGSIFSMAANKLLPIEEVVAHHYPQFIDATGDLERLMKAFEQYKRERHLLTYDDLLVRLCEALESSEELTRKLSSQYGYIMVDEYQDTNRLQARIVRLMAASHDNVAVVGDECQAIYSFRGASFRNMLEFPELFPDARVIKLEENFRSTQPVLDLANIIIGEASEGYSKRLFSRATEGPPPMLVSASDENEQSRFVVQRIEELREEGIPYQEMAVLFRAGSHSFDLEIELGKHGIPFRKFGGIKFAESAHIKDALSFLRVVVNPSDTISWFRMLKLVDHIGDATVQQILDHLGVEKKEFRTARAKEGLFKKLKGFPARASYKDQLVRLANVLQSVLEHKSVRSQLSTVERFYRPILQAIYDDHPRRRREMEHLISIAKRYKSAEELLSEVALEPVETALAEAQARGQGFVTLSTVHSAKGLEWDALFILWMVDGWFPSSRAYDAFENLEEERRLLYVAATRAKRHLYFISPMSYESVSVSSYGSVSRFLELIPETLLTRAALAGE
ncbi:MAG TPA: UvrD-helicase domain-containing protein [Blastocatellia bacterium]|jgi:DNA helicase-2/ATP-dependent DNA helicase PcrA|nr:UvrD-helicase domain-containing protein [Blastocatellia bacterium]